MKLIRNLFRYGVVSVIAVALAGWLIPLIGLGVQGGALMDKAVTQIAAPTSTFAPPKWAVPPEAVISRIEIIGELATAKYETTGAVKVSQDNPGLEFAGVIWWKPENTVVTMFAVGTARAGFDLTQATFWIDDNTFTINLPGPSFISWTMDTKQSYFVEFDVPYEIGIIEIGSVRPETATYTNQQAELAGRAEACEIGILATANSAAVEKLTALFADMSFDAITVNTQPPGECQ